MDLYQPPQIKRVDKNLKKIADTYNVDPESARHLKNALNLLKIRKGLLDKEQYQEKKFREENEHFLSHYRYQ